MESQICYSSNSDKWTRADARALVEHLESQEINIETELDNIAKSKGKSAYIDDNQNKLLGVTEKSKKFGIFQEYQNSGLSSRGEG